MNGQTLTSSEWQTLSEAYAFLGNSLLTPMTRTATVGLDPAFWEAFPDFGSDALRQALTQCRDYAAARRGADEGHEPSEDAVQAAAVEFTHLFMGPPSPAAAPWETFYLKKDSTVGFGAPTFAMREALRQAGLQEDGEMNQYEDHMGLELLLLAELCHRLAAGEEPFPGVTMGSGHFVTATTATKQPDPIVTVAEYLRARPLSWVDDFAAAVSEAAPQGYFAGLVPVAAALLKWQDGCSPL